MQVYVVEMGRYWVRLADVISKDIQAFAAVDQDAYVYIVHSESEMHRVDQYVRQDLFHQSSWTEWVQATPLTEDPHLSDMYIRTVSDHLQRCYDSKGALKMALTQLDLSDLPSM